MISKKVKYVDFNGNECEETLYFNMNEAEGVRLQHTGAAVLGFDSKKEFSTVIEEVVKSGDNKALLDLLDMLLVESYGEKSEDGKRFIKTKAMKEAFIQSAAYPAVYVEIMKDEKAAKNFFKGIFSYNVKHKAK